MGLNLLMFYLFSSSMFTFRDCERQQMNTKKMTLIIEILSLTTNNWVWPALALATLSITSLFLSNRIMVSFVVVMCPDQRLLPISFEATFGHVAKF